MKIGNALSAGAGFALAALFATSALADGTVNIYTYRQPELIQPVLDAFTAETGIKTEVLFLDKGLEERVAAEGANSPADVIMTVDIARLTKAKENGITQPLVDETVNKLLPAEYRDPEGNWFGLTKRARVVYASKDRVKDTAITYADLADPKWKGKICIRSGQHDYNLALFSAAIDHWGAEKTEEWMRGLKANLAKKPDGGDRPQAGAIAAGECDIALGNTYYVGLMRTNEKDPKEKEWGNAINVIFPTFENGLTHVNISGIALAKHAPNRDNAVKLIQFLASHKAQQVYAEKNFEYPVEPGLEPSEMVKAFGELKADTLPLADIAKNRKAASEMVDRVGLDDGPSS
ncbi:iron(III) transport system substrate-binding protein [Mesorhizobium albiziae]|uniref:Iron(III) transport system substrate-binding protein n=1 Tax=Neomesorhizobium albiziae TaxID=335020 RepID=A0A1I4B6R1_9HYPH|nr:Fe(3+) ABC transporter substrate-binding protein [Mesorhizobium albiziae]GLS34318.1 iron ABC transporter substrate-binding protein [Mesorhizobium albiziae]SFK63599.1 iron(III) transport system substrate-binding protein [Mesorhizobium albiziae]